MKSAIPNRKLVPATLKTLLVRYSSVEVRSKFLPIVTPSSVEPHQRLYARILFQLPFPYQSLPYFHCPIQYNPFELD